ncbi:hypothetical protein CDAR_581021 [Caerostris darwini]|uniref:Secreted protein n=1 Tax=Caerostris darwini TaxID=1538125 RepID=A0AAV4WQF5_9ARAC|nr:hypothetical protein CDAR_581021 [Caerostris darwini]
MFSCRLVCVSFGSVHALVSSSKPTPPRTTSLLTPTISRLKLFFSPSKVSICVRSTSGEGGPHELVCQQTEAPTKSEAHSFFHYALLRKTKGKDRTFCLSDLCGEKTRAVILDLGVLPLTRSMWEF